MSVLKIRVIPTVAHFHGQREHGLRPSRHGDDVPRFVCDGFVVGEAGEPLDRRET